MSNEQTKIEEVDKLIEKAQQSNFAISINDTPALKDAYEKIKTIRGLTSTSKPKGYSTGWEFMESYNNIQEAETTTNIALKEAWDAFYMLKELMQK